MSSRNKIAVFSILILIAVVIAGPLFAQGKIGDPIPEFPEAISILLGVGASAVVGFFKKFLPENDLVRLLTAAAVSVAAAFIALLVAGVSLSADAAYLIAATFAFSQVTWTSFKAIVGLSK